MRFFTSFLLFAFFISLPFYGKAEQPPALPIKSSLSLLNPSGGGESLNTFEGVDVSRPETTEAQSDDDSALSQDRCCDRERKNNDWAQGISPAERRKWLKLALGPSGSSPAPARPKAPSSSGGSKGQR